MGGSGASSKMGGWLKNERAISKAENDIRDSEIEHCLIFNKHGDILCRFDGDESSVGGDFETEEDCGTTHNHPDTILEDGTRMEANSFSEEDLESMVESGEFVSRMVTSRHTHILERIDGFNNGIRGQLAVAYERHHNIVRNRFRMEASQKIAKGEFKTSSEATVWMNTQIDNSLNLWLKNNASKYGYEYSQRSKKR